MELNTIIKELQSIQSQNSYVVDNINKQIEKLKTEFMENTEHHQIYDFIEDKFESYDEVDELGHDLGQFLLNRAKECDSYLTDDYSSLEDVMRAIRSFEKEFYPTRYEINKLKSLLKQ